MNKEEYPVTRLQAAHCLRDGIQLKVEFDGERTVQVMLRLDRLKKKVACRIWSGTGVWWTILSWKQTLGFIRRNYARDYFEVT